MSQADTFRMQPARHPSYEKARFEHEGRLRRTFLREGKGRDMLFMGILRPEWMEENDYTITDK